MNTVICSTQEATYRDFALEQSVHNEEEIFIQPFLLELFAEVAQDGHRWNHRGYGLQVMSQDPRTNAGLAVTEHHHKESIQRLEMERFTCKRRLHIYTCTFSSLIKTCTLCRHVYILLLS